MARAIDHAQRAELHCRGRRQLESLQERAQAVD